jgi:acyl-homoserine lactone acylase PvdQ
MKLLSNLKLEKFFFFWVYLILSVSIFSSSLVLCSKKKEGEKYRLQNPVHVVIDRCGVPHIFAESDSDAFFILGYIQAHFRLFQMDMSRRASTGRLAELFPEMLTQDIIQRMLGFKFISEKTLESFKDTGMLKKVQAFVDGINQYIDDAKEGREFGGLKPQIPLQYQILKKEPQYFSVVDVIAIGKKRAFDLSGGGGIFDIASKLVEIIFGEDFEKKFSLSAVEKTKIVDDLPKVRITPFSISESDEPRKFASKLKSYELKSEDINKIIENISRKIRDIKLPLSVGSNNFVISGKITKTGYPILENDPHLQVNSPSVFFPFQINSPEYSVKGFGFPGAPVVLVGGGDNVCWGVTVSFIDTIDIVITPVENIGGEFYVRWGKEKIKAEVVEEEIFYENLEEESSLKSQKIRFLYVPNIGVVVDPGDQKDFSSLLPYILNLAGAQTENSSLADIVRDLLKYFLTVGIIDEKERNKVPSLGIMVVWPGYKPTSEISAFYGAARAKDIFEAMTQVKFFQVGTQNFILADTKGNIGYFPHVEVPIRAQGVKPYIPNLSDKLFWVGFLSPDFIPRAINPTSGYIVTANNDIIGTSFDNDPLNERWYIGTFFDFGFRAKNISSLIEKNKQNIDKITTAQILNSAESELAKLFLNVFFKFISDEDIQAISESEEKKEFIRFMLEKLKSWDFQNDVNSPEPLYYEMIMRMSFASFAWENFIKRFFPSRLSDILISALKGTEFEGIAKAIYEVGLVPLSTALFDLISDPQVIIRSAFPVISGEKGEVCPKETTEVSNLDMRKIYLGDDLCPKDEFLKAISKTADFLIQNAKKCKKELEGSCVEFICKGGEPKNCVLGDFVGKKFDYLIDIPKKELFEPTYYGNKYFRKSAGTGLVYAADFDPVKLSGKVETKEDLSSVSLDFKEPSGEKEFVAFEVSSSNGQTLKYICEAKPTGTEVWFAIPGGVADDPASPYFANMITAWACQREWLRGVTQGYCAIPKEISPKNFSQEELFKISFSKFETDFSSLMSGNYHTSPVCNRKEIYLVFTPQ